TSDFGTPDASARPNPFLTRPLVGPLTRLVSGPRPVLVESSASARAGDRFGAPAGCSGEPPRPSEHDTRRALAPRRGARLGSGRAFDGCAPAPRPTHRSPEATSTSGLREALLYGAREPATGPSTSATALVVSARSVRFAPP